MPEKVFERTRGLTDIPFHYCPGCTHGVIHRLIAEALVAEGVLGETLGVSSVGCTYNNYLYFNCDMVQAAHGRAPAVATGLKRVHPDRTVFTYQGDGDLAAIGTAEILHAAARGEKITAFFVNNAVYGMTSGQMAPTTLVGQVTTTSPFGRDPETQGYPINVSEIIASLRGAAYVARVSAHSVKHIAQAGHAIRRALQLQRAGAGFTMVEILSTCPVNWGMSPDKAMAWVRDAMIPQYPLGVYKDVEAES